MQHCRYPFQIILPSFCPMCEKFDYLNFWVVGLIPDLDAF